MSQNTAWKLYVAICVCYPLAFVGVALRCYVRYLMQKISGWDDWLMVLSLALYTMAIGFLLKGIQHGTGEQTANLEESDFLLALKYSYFTEWSYVLTVTTVKLSIGLFYLRIIIPPWQRWVVKCTTWIAVLFGFAYLWLLVIQCWPIPFIWERYSRISSNVRTAGCLPMGFVVGATYAHSIINAASDWALALLPILMLWNVHMPIGVRFIVGGVVGCGILASVATLIRMSTISTARDIRDLTFNGIALLVWSYVELGVIIFAACLATLRPLLWRFSPDHFRKLAFRKQPELNIPADLAGKGDTPEDAEMGNAVAIESGKAAVPNVRDSLRTIEVHWDYRDGERNEEWVATPITFLRESSSSSSSASTTLELGFEVEDAPHPTLRPPSDILLDTFSKRASSSTSGSEWLGHDMEDYPRTALRPCPHLPTLPPTPTNSSPTILSPTTFSSQTVLPISGAPASPSPSHIAFSMRDSQYSRNSKVIKSSFPL